MLTADCISSSGRLVSDMVDNSLRCGRWSICGVGWTDDLCLHLPTAVK